MATAKDIEFLISGLVDSSGNRLDSGTITFYEDNSSTLKDIWLDADKNDLAANPYELSAVGTASLYGDGIYRIVVKDSNGVTTLTQNGIQLKPLDAGAETYIDASDFGAMDNTSISDAITFAAGNDRSILLIPGNWAINDNLTIPSNINLLFAFGAYATIAATKTLTYVGTCEAPMYNIHRGLGSVVFSDKTAIIPTVWQISGDAEDVTFTGKIIIDDSVSGGLLIGNTTNRTIGVAYTVQLEGVSAASSGISAIRDSDNANGPAITFGKTRGSTIGGTTIVQTGDTLGNVLAFGSDGTDFIQAASIRFIVEGTPASADVAGAITFYTTPTGGGSTAERARFTAAGRLGIGTSSPAEKLHVDGNIRTNTGQTIYTDNFIGISGTLSLGTAGADALVFKQSSSERMRIASGGKIGIGTTTPDASSIVDVTSTTAGFLPPRMTTAQRDAIASPAAGLIIYNTSTAKLNVYTTAWEAVTSV